MGGEETTKSPLRGSLWDVGRTPEWVASDSKEEGEGGGDGQTGEPDGREDGAMNRHDREGGNGREQIEDA